MGGKTLDLKGKVFGKLEVLSDRILRKTNSGFNQSWFLCECSCGVQKEIRAASLKSGSTKSCGCLNVEKGLTHGHSKSNNGNPTPTYSSWMSARRRAKIKPGQKDYETYKDVSMCGRWFNSFEAFLEDMGERPEGKTLDRYPDKTGNYEPSNCRWATPKQQCNNTAFNKCITFQGKTQTLQEWSEEIGIKPSTL